MAIEAGRSLERYRKTNARNPESRTGIIGGKWGRVDGGFWGVVGVGLVGGRKVERDGGGARGGNRAFLLRQLL